MRILVVGAGGYVGGRLVPRLLAAGHDLTLGTRRPAPVAHRFPQAKVVATDPIHPASLTGIARAVEAVYVLPETIVRPGSDAWLAELRAARAIGSAVAVADRDDGACRAIIHLAELGDAPAGTPSGEPGAPSSAGRALAASGARLLELRASLVVGSGSAPFEMVRHLTDRVAVMATPRWVEAPAQPIAIRDVLGYLLAALEHDQAGVIEIGGAHVLSFADMLLRYARVRGLRRVRVPLPIETPRGSAAWVSLVSPLPAGVAATIIERLHNGVVVRDPTRAAGLGVSPLGYEEMIRLALERTVENRVETTWFDTFETRAGRPPLDGPASSPEALATERRMLIDRQSLEIAAPPERVFAEVERVGGAAGWPAANALWRIRGLVDRIVGGVGMRLGRRDTERLRLGDALDFWRVEALDRPHLLRLRAEMRIPGRAWLQYEVEPTPVGSRLTQTAYFDPSGPAGYAYWYLLLPLHDPIFRVTVRVLARRATA
jgi:uncharacterized protein YbjT (DUF2867 family)